MWFSCCTTPPAAIENDEAVCETSQQAMGDSSLHEPAAPPASAKVELDVMAPAENAVVAPAEPLPAPLAEAAPAVEENKQEENGEELGPGEDGEQAPGEEVEGGDEGPGKVTGVIKSENQNKFAARSGTSRYLDIDSKKTENKNMSTLDLSVKDYIDPEKGLRRLESVSTPAGTIEETYQVIKKLGEGSFGLVMQVEKKDTKEIFAMKIIPVKNLKDTARFDKELAVSRRLKHPTIIKLHESYSDGEKYHLVMEFSDGGDLFEKVQKTRRKKDNHSIMGLASLQVAQYAWQMLTGVAYLHHYDFAHRDIKPENYLLIADRRGGGVKLIDFGLARQFEKGVFMTSRVGTPHYVAPEVVNNKINGYNHKCDLWSVGVALWFMCIGELPFTAGNQQDILKQVVKGSYRIKPYLWELHGHPQELQNLITSLLIKDPEQRPAAKTPVAENAWLIEHGDPVKVQNKQCCSVS